MPLAFRLSFIALLVAVPGVVHAQSVNDFTLEPAPTATPQAQGPADARGGVEIRPRAVNTPSATPTPASMPTPEAPPLAEQPTPRSSAAAPAPVSSPLPTVTPRPDRTAPNQPQLPPGTAENLGSDASGAVPDPASVGARSPAQLPAGQTPSDILPAENASEGWPWLPIGAAALLIALILAGYGAWRRRRDGFVPDIERPVVAVPTRSEPVVLAQALRLQVEHDKLIRSAAFATLQYRMTVTNHTDMALADVAVGLDLVSAHAAAPMEEQVATDSAALEKRHAIARIAPHQSVTLEGQVQLPLAQAHVIRQGRFPLLVPLLRVRIDGPGEGALLKTYVVGQGVPGGGRVQPFRLDEGPRSYAPIAQRELA